MISERTDAALAGSTKKLGGFRSNEKAPPWNTPSCLPRCDGRRRRPAPRIFFPIFA